MTDVVDEQKVDVDADKTADAKTPPESTKDNNKKEESNSEENKTFSGDYVRDLRKESANYRTQAKELQKKADDAEKKAAELNDSLKARSEESQKALNESKRLNSVFEQRVINAELKAASMEAGLVDMDAFKMVDLSIIKITDQGDVIGIKDVITNLKKDKPYLFKEITTSKKNSNAPQDTDGAKEKPTYSTPQELANAKKKFFASLT